VAQAGNLAVVLRSWEAQVGSLAVVLRSWTDHSQYEQSHNRAAQAGKVLAAPGKAGKEAVAQDKLVLGRRVAQGKVEEVVRDTQVPR